MKPKPIKFNKLTVRLSKRKKRKKSPWEKIVDAAQKGVGVRLNQDEVGKLWMDDAICTRAALDALGEP